ncbi:hypothetical protein JCM10207_008546 [Rhodosporidiobolus poonsookiae]
MTLPRTALRTLLPSLPSSLRSSLLAPTLLRPALISSRTLPGARTAPPSRAFALSAPARDRYAAVAKDPKWRNSQPVTYEELKPITKSPSDDILLIDVREPNEVALGSIPSSVNLPLSTFEKALRMDEGDFVREYGFRKPTKTQPYITYCKAGVRAQTALDLAKSAGYKWGRNYEGSYNDWEKHEQKSGEQDD